ncbi:MAG: porin family protein [Rhizobiaceae bacterium]|nr:porin family protein [Rhizobiaceae bacterium]MBO6724066.1 porin family protein [Rhizobiaceae bacterium]
MLRLAKPVVLGAALIAGMAAPALAADIYEPPIVEAPPPIYNEPIPVEHSFGGWYIRGDIDYHLSTFRGANYITYGTPGGLGRFDFGNLRGAFSGGLGVGYKINKWFRADLTADYFFRSSFTGQTSGVCPGGGACTSVDTSGYSAIVAMANAYVDLGTWHKITPYVGAGIGGARLKWDTLNNTVGGTTTSHTGATSWRFAWAVMAGASYCINPNWAVDVGYRYMRISGGRMFEYAPQAGPGFDAGIDVHEGRAGVRYQFGGGNPGCGKKQEFIPYEPEPLPPVVYK